MKQYVYTMHHAYHVGQQIIVILSLEFCIYFLHLT